MRSDDKTEEGLLAELVLMRRRVEDLERREARLKDTERLLSETESKLQALTENGSTAIFLVQGQKYIYANPAFCEWTGYTFAELSAMDFWDIVSPDMQELIMKKGMARQRGEDIPSRYDVKFVTKSGQERCGDLNVTLVRYQDGQAILGCLLDITERKWAEEALRASEERCRTIIEYVPDVIYSLSADGGIIMSLNPAFEKLTGWSVDEWLGKPFMSIMHPDDLGLALEVFSNTLLGGTRGPVELRVLAKSGDYLVGEFSCQPRTENGQVVGVLGIVRDVTDRKQAEDLQKQAEQRYRSIFENAMEGIFLSTPEGCYLNANPALARIYGFDSPEELLGAVTDIGNQIYVHPEDRIRLKHMVDEYGSVEGFEIEQYRKDGSAIWTSSNVRSVRDAYGKDLYYEGVVQDITARRKAEEALRESEERYRIAIESSNDGIAIMKGASHVYVNKKFVEMFGYESPDEIIGKTNSLTVHPDDFPMVKDINIRRQKGEPVPQRYEFKGIKKDGTLIHIEVSATNMMFRGNHVSLAYMRDISERKVFEKTLQAKHQQLLDIIEFLPDPTFVIDQDRRVIAWNRALEEMTGVKKEEILGTNNYSVPFYGEKRPILIDLILQPDQESEKLYDLVQRKGDVLYGEVFIPHLHEGKGAYCWLTASTLLDGTGNVAGAIESIRDVTDRKVIATALRKSEEKYRNIFENAVMGIFQTTPDGRYLSANRELAWMFGHDSPEEMIADVTDIGQQQYVHPEDRTRLKEVLQCLDVVHRFETQIYRKDGTMMWISLNGRAVRGKDGKILFHEGTIEDITERKRSEEALRESEERYRALFDRSLDGVYIADFEGHFIDANQAALDLVGYRREDIPVVTWASLLPEDQLLLALEQVDEVRANGSQKNLIKYRVRRKNGEEVFVEVQASLIYHEGKPFAIQGVVRDVTERNRAEGALRESEKKFRDIAELAPQMIYEMDRDGRLTFANKEFYRILGITEEDYRSGIDIHSLFSPDELPRVRLNLKKIVEQGFSKGNEYIMIRKDGSKVPVIAYSAPIYEDGETTGFRGILVDITERKNLESQLMQAQKMESIGTLAGGIAHDFNNLLTTILGCGQLLKMKGDLDVRSDNYVDRIIEAAESAAQLTQNILAFSRKQPTKVAVVDVNMVIKKVEKMALRTIEENIELEVLPSKDDLNIVADTSQLEQILMNLIVNARDAMPDGGRLTIQTEQVQLGQEFIERHGGGGKPGGYAKIVVADNGIGMARKTVDRIFEPFFTTKEVGKGTGLGLSITHGIVRKHDGYITVSSAPGKGTTFEVYFPLTDTAGDAQIATPAEVRLQKGNETLLVAEDDPFTRNMLQTILEEGGYGIIEAVDGEDALQKYVQHKERIEMIILDVIMPKMNGKAVYDAIKVMDPFQRILFISGYTPDEISRSGIFQENSNLIKKPFLPDELLAKIREVLRR